MELLLFQLDNFILLFGICLPGNLCAFPLALKYRYIFSLVIVDHFTLDYFKYILVFIDFNFYLDYFKNCWIEGSDKEISYSFYMYVGITS